MVDDRFAAINSLTGMAIEQKILGLMITHPDSTAETLASETPISGEDFASPEHAAAFAAIQAMMRDGERPTPLMVAARLGVETIAGLAAKDYWTRLVLDADTLINFADYVGTLRELSARRGLMDAAREIADCVSRPPMEITARQIAENADAAIFKSTQGHQKGSRWVTLGEAAQRALTASAEAHDRKGGLSGHSTGFRDLDAKLGGLQPSDLIVIAARPGMGKSALAMDIAGSIAGSRKPVAFFTLEMSAEQLAMRKLSDRSGVSSARLRRGDYSSDEFDVVTRRSREFVDVPLYIDETGAISISQCAAKVRRLQRRHGLEAVVVDYLQLMTAGMRRGDNRVQEISAITGGLKAIAKDLDVPVVALSQLSRDVEKRNEKRPMLADLRESGSIEQDADVVMFLYREEYYLARERPVEGDQIIEWQAKLEAAAGRAEVIIAKQRHGPLGSVDLHWNAETTSFSDRHQQHEADW